LRDELKDHQIYNKTELKRINNEIKSLKKENVELSQRITINQNKVEDLELFIGFKRKPKK